MQELRNVAYCQRHSLGDQLRDPKYSMRKERQNTVMWGIGRENGTTQETREGGVRETQKTDWDSVTQIDKPI